MTTINNKLANLGIYGYIWLLYMVVLLVTPGGSGNSAYERGEDARQKFLIKRDRSGRNPSFTIVGERKGKGMATSSTSETNRFKIQIGETSTTPPPSPP